MNETVDVQDVPAPAVELPAQASLMQLVDALLKTPAALTGQISANCFQANLVKLLVLALLCYLGYGLIVGSFSGHAQWWAAPLKIAAGVALSALLCYPSLYILAALSGADLRPGQIAALLASSLALTGILLTGFAPVAFIFTFSTSTLPFMGMIHLLIATISFYFGMRYLITALERLGGKDAPLLNLWVVILSLTLLQMSTTLRPILGQSEHFFSSEKRFFLEHWGETLHDTTSDVSPR